VHGTLYSPELFDYIQTSYDAFLSMSQLPGEVCFLGHSHIPVTFIQRRFITYSFEREITVEPGTKVLVNVGSVGQPRDNNPNASYALFDTVARKVSVRRVAYDIDAAAASIREAGLPEVLGERLKIGR
jgi:diadenosine tetraphosphatase ApaH/serine/threonine PP2A family protein phosphatase